MSSNHRAKMDELEEDLEITWTTTNRGWTTPYGYEIRKAEYTYEFKVFHRCKPVITVYSLYAAKRIVNILVNDIILYKEIDTDNLNENDKAA